MNLATKLTVPPQVMSRLVGDETVLLNLETGIYFGLDGVSRQIWDAVVEGDSLEQIAASIVSEYNVDKLQAQADVLEFANELVERGLLAE